VLLVVALVLLLVLGAALLYLATRPPGLRVAVRPGSDGPVLFQAVSVFDGERFVGSKDVRVARGVVVEVAEPKTLEPASGERVVSGEGLTLLPGFVDLHAHVESNGNALWDLGLPD